MKSKKKLFSTCFLLIFALTACGQADEIKTSGGEQSNVTAGDYPSSIQFPSGSTGGGFYQIAGIIGNEIESHFNIPVSTMPSGGSGENLNLIESGEAQITLSATNSIWPAYNGSLHFEGKQHEDFRLVAMLHTLPTVFFAQEDSGLENVSDLKGKRIGVGASPLPFDYITGPVLNAHGIDYQNEIDGVYVGFGDAGTQMGDRQLDASIGTSRMPIIQQFASQHNPVWLEFDETAIDNMIAEYPYFSKLRIDGSLLPGYEGDEYLTFDMGATYLIVNKDLSDEFVYELTKMLHENIDKISKNSSDLKEVAENNDLLTNLVGETPFHPGAQKYWEEVGLWQE